MTSEELNPKQVPKRTENIVSKPKVEGGIPASALNTNVQSQRFTGVDTTIPDSASAKPMNKQAVGQQTTVAQVNNIDTPVNPNPNIDPKKQKLINKKKKEKQSKKIFLLVTLFLLGTFILFGLIFLLVFSATSPENNPFIQLFGLEVEQWIPFLINLISIFFGLVVIISLVVGMIGVFKVGSAPKDNKVAKKKGVIMSILGSSILVVTIIVWMFTYLWLDSKKSEYVNTNIEYIQTIPEEVTALTAPMVIKFDASAIEEMVNPREKQTLSYVWQFGDGTKQTGKIVSHEYLSKGAVDGSYNVTLTIRYKNLKTGEEASENFNKIIVFDNEKVAAVFSVNKEEGPLPLEVEFSASDSVDPDGSIIEYLWDFDEDGDFDDGAGENVVYTFNQSGDINVKLKVIDNSNDYAISEKIIKVTQPLEAKAVIDSSAEKGVYLLNEEYTFDATGSSSPIGAIRSYRWDFGDGTTATTRTITHKFERVGKYIIILEVEDLEKNRDMSSVEINVTEPSQPPRAVITPTPGFTDDNGTFISGVAPFQVSFSASDSSDPDNDIVDYNWDFDSDGTIDASGEIVSYTYNSVGDYTAVLHVTDSLGNETSQTLLTKVSKQGLKARITSDILEGEVPLAVTFDASGSSYPDGKIISYQWNFGDGSASRFDDSNITYEYTKVGEFKASVSVKAEDGEEEVSDVIINVRPVAVRACFSSDKTEGDAPLDVNFKASCSTGTISNYTWKINGVTTPSTPAHKLSYTFEEPGIYEIKLIVKDNQGVLDEFTKSVSIFGEE